MQIKIKSKITEENFVIKIDNEGIFQRIKTHISLNPNDEYRLSEFIPDQDIINVNRIIENDK